MNPDRLKQLQNYQFSEYTDCEDRILILLLDENWGFEELVIGTKKSRGTVNTHLDRLYNKIPPWIKHVDPYARSVSSPYCLTEEGKKQAEEIRPATFIRSLPNAQLAHFFYMNRFRRIKELNQLLFPENQNNRPDWRSTIPQSANDVVRFSNAIDKDLRKLGLNDDELYKLWIYLDGYYLNQLVALFGAPSYFALLPVEARIEQHSDEQKENELKLAKERLGKFYILF
jgi:hypothetical protein